MIQAPNHTMKPSNLIREQQAHHTVLISSPDPDAYLVDYQLHLLVRCRPTWLPICYLRYSTEPQICYDLTDLYSLDEIDLSKRTPDQGKEIMIQICSCLTEAADQLLPIHQFSLDPSMIYLDQQHKIHLIFWPFKRKASNDATQTESTPDSADNPDGFTRLIERIGQAFHWESSMTRRFIQHAHSGSAALSDHLKQIDGTKQNEAPVQTTTATGKASNDRNSHQKQTKASAVARIIPRLLLLTMILLHIAAATFAILIARNLFVSLKPVVFGTAIFLGICDLLILVVKNKQTCRETFTRLYQQCRSIWLGNNQDSKPADDATVLLPQADSGFRMAMFSEGKPGTIEENEGQRAFILSDEFLVGRDPKKTDLCLSDQAIGRMHARIIRRAGSFFICDLGSANGTKLDGRRLAKHTETQLPDQCLIEFAQRSFYFQADS